MSDIRTVWVDTAWCKTLPSGGEFLYEVPYGIDLDSHGAVCFNEKRLDRCPIWQFVGQDRRERLQGHTKRDHGRRES